MYVPDSRSPAFQELPEGWYWRLRSSAQNRPGSAAMRHRWPHHHDFGQTISLLLLTASDLGLYPITALHQATQNATPVLGSKVDGERGAQIPVDEERGPQSCIHRHTDSGAEEASLDGSWSH